MRELTIDRRAQQTMGMPFSMMFAIFLIIVFIAIAFIAIGHFLDIGRSANVGMFYRDLQDAIDGALSEQYSNVSFDVDLPSDIKQVCFANLSAGITDSLSLEYKAIKNYDIYDANVFLIPPKHAQDMQWKLIRHINITRITQNENPYCVDTDDKLMINKGFYDKLVWVS